MRKISYTKKVIFLGSLLLLGFFIVWLFALRLALSNFILGVSIAGVMAFLAAIYFVIIRNFWKGEMGEEAVQSILRNLPNSFFVLKDVVLENKGNIDFVVIGHTGVWTIEVKNLRSGEITYENGLLCKNHFPIGGRPLKQSHGEASALQEHIKQTLGIFTPVHPVIVFANPRNKIRFGLNGVEEIQVIGIKWLKELLTKHNVFSPLSMEQCLALKDEIRKYGNFS